MIHYHGTPLTPEHAAAAVYNGRHAMVSFAHPEQIGLIAEICQSFCFDNGEWSRWKSGISTGNHDDFYAWVEKWMLHPGFDWFIIPDKIDGCEEENDDLLAECPHSYHAVPVWHLHESLERLERLAFAYPRIALGSSGEFAQINTSEWWTRMGSVMDVVCNDQGMPVTRLHGLRMLDPRIFGRFPFASADSTNVARNVGYDGRWYGTYEPANKAARGIVIAGNVEKSQSAPLWMPVREDNQFPLFGGLDD